MIPAEEIIAAIIAIGGEIGKDLLPLFQEKIPALKTDPLPDAQDEMNTARDEALKRVKP